jgi:predicted HicB family RNase H-like nuclease
VIETKKTRKPGRPKLPRGESKGKFLRVRVTPDELRAFEKAARSGGKSVSEWSRSILNSAIGG